MTRSEAFVRSASIAVGTIFGLICLGLLWVVLLHVFDQQRERGVADQVRDISFFEHSLNDLRTDGPIDYYYYAGRGSYPFLAIAGRIAETELPAFLKANSKNSILEEDVNRTVRCDALDVEIELKGQDLLEVFVSTPEVQGRLNISTDTGEFIGELTSRRRYH